MTASPMANLLQSARDLVAEILDEDKDLGDLSDRTQVLFDLAEAFRTLDEAGFVRKIHHFPQGQLEMLGRMVRVKLGEHVVEQGILLGYGEGGDIELEGGDGLVYHCWPALEVTLIEGEGK